MQATTATAIKAIISADQTLDPEARNRIMRAIATPSTTEAPGERILRRSEAAKRLACCVRTLDRLVNQGILHKVSFPGRQRAAGFRASDIDALILGRAA